MAERYVQLPNGSYLEWPEGVSAADFKAKAQKLIGGPSPDNPAAPYQPPKPDLQRVASPVTAAREFGGGLLHTIPDMLTHPGETLSSMGQPVTASGVAPEGMYPATAPLGGSDPGIGGLHAVQNEAQEGQAENAREIAANPARAAGGLTATTLASLGAAKLTPIAGRGLMSGAGALNDALIGTPAEGLHGAEPGLTMAKYGVTGSSPSSLTRVLSERIPEVTAEHRGIVAGAPTTTRINTGPIIAPAFQDEIAAGTNPRTGAASPSQIGIAGRTMRQLTHVPDESTGQVTPMMRDPNLSPLEATDLKSNIYDRTNYDPSGKYNIANTGLKSAAHGLKTAVEQTVPESAESGHDLHSLVQAKEILNPAARGQLGIPTTRGGLIEHAVTGTGTNAASGAYGLGEGLTTAPVMPLAAIPAAAGLRGSPTDDLMRYLRQQPGGAQ
jgi:hypothetical protein